MTEHVWKKRRCKIPGVVGGYSTEIEGTEIMVREKDGKWMWSFRPIFVGSDTTLEEAKENAITSLGLMMQYWLLVMLDGSVRE